MIGPENSAVVQTSSASHHRYSVYSDRLIPFSILALAAYALLRSAAYAVIKPFWFDEVLTFIVSRPGNQSAVWAAPKQGVDGNPPAFYLLERWASALFSNENIGYRLPSILAFACTVLLVFVFIRTRHGSQTALLSSALLLITPLFTFYAQEARPYCLVAALIALALVCYQRAPRPIWTFALSLSLILATLVHYYAFLTLAPFFLAELTVLYFAKRIRFSVWLALLLTLVPIVFSWPSLMAMKRNWGTHLWSGGTLSEVSAAYGNYFRLGSAWGVALCIFTIGFMLFPLLRGTHAGNDRTQTEPLRPEERVLAAGLVALPLLGFAVAKITHGPFLERYFMVSILGVITGIASIVRFASPKVVVCSGAIVFLALASQEVGFWKGFNSRQDVASVVSPIVALSDTSRYPDLPIVLSNCAQYVELWHYAPPGLFRGVFTLPDPTKAASYVGFDTADKIVLALRPYNPEGIQDFSKFSTTHPKFILYSDGSRVDWWPARLLHDGYRLQLLRLESHGAAYLVEAPASSPAAP